MYRIGLQAPLRYVEIYHALCMLSWNDPIGIAFQSQCFQPSHIQDIVCPMSPSTTPYFRIITSINTLRPRYRCYGYVALADSAHSSPKEMDSTDINTEQEPRKPTAIIITFLPRL